MHSAAQALGKAAPPSPGLHRPIGTPGDDGPTDQAVRLSTRDSCPAMMPTWLVTPCPLCSSLIALKHK